MKDFLLLSYDTVCLRPKFSTLPSRSDADTSVDFLGRRFKLPVIPANMEDVISPDNAKFLSENDYFYIYHRFGKENSDHPHLKTSTLIKKANQENWKCISVSIGTNEYEPELAIPIGESWRIDFITIDVAHGHHINVRPAIEFIRKWFPKTKLIVGNVATGAGIHYLELLRVDAIKVGIGGGCFIPNTKVLTENGYKNIQDIVVGEKVLTHLDTFEEVTHTFSEDRDEEVIRINNNITCTKNHEFYVVHKKHESIVNDKNIHQYAEWISAEKLSHEYFLIKM